LKQPAADGVDVFACSRGIDQPPRHTSPDQR
jgi:hypothetical protein